MPFQMFTNTLSLSHALCLTLSFSRTHTQTLTLRSCLLPLSLSGARGHQAALHYAHLSPSLCASVLIGLTWTPSRFDCLLSPLFHPRVSIIVVSISPVQTLSVFCSCLWLLNVHCMYLLLVSSVDPYNSCT